MFNNSISKITQVINRLNVIGPNVKTQPVLIKSLSILYSADKLFHKCDRKATSEKRTSLHTCSLLGSVNAERHYCRCFLTEPSSKLFNGSAFLF